MEVSARGSPHRATTAGGWAGAFWWAVRLEHQVPYLQHRPTRRLSRRAKNPCPASADRPNMNRQSETAPPRAGRGTHEVRDQAPSDEPKHHEPDPHEVASVVLGQSRRELGDVPGHDEVSDARLPDEVLRVTRPSGAEAEGLSGICTACRRSPRCRSGPAPRRAGLTWEVLAAVLADDCFLPGSPRRRTGTSSWLPPGRSLLGLRALSQSLRQDLALRRRALQ